MTPASSSSAGFLLAAEKPIVVDPAHLDLATQSLWLVVAMVVAFFVVRPELWRRLAIGPVDPRPVALVRIAFGITIFWTLLDLTMWAEILFTDQGMFTTEVARKKYGGALRAAWDPEHGFESNWEMVKIAATSWTVFHVRSDPTFVYTIWGITFLAVATMTLGLWTRISTFIAFLGVMQIYNYTPIWYAGGDTVTRCMLLLGVFCRWGEAYSLDAWWRRRREILRGPGDALAALRTIPAWPQRLMAFQLAVIYCSTGVLKSGHTWGKTGSAIYYAVNLDHFYRFPMTGFSTLLYRIQVLRVQTWIVHWWECLFPVALLGAAVAVWERTKDLEPSDAPGAFWRPVSQQPWGQPAAWRRVLSWVIVGIVVLLGARVGGLAAQYHYNVRYLPPWLRVGPENMRTIVTVFIAAIPPVAVGLYAGVRRISAKARARIDELEPGKSPSRLQRVAAGLHWFVLHWVLGKRLWLGLGTAMHLGIAVLLNVGTFVHVMLSFYPTFFVGDEVDRVWRYVGSRPAAPGEGERPAGSTGLFRRVWARFRYRVPAAPYVVLHAPDDLSVRRAALLRCWDLAGRLEFERDSDLDPERLVIRTPQGDRLEGGLAGAMLTNLLPGLWLLWAPGFVVEQVFRPLGLLPDGVRRGLGTVGARMVGQRP